MSNDELLACQNTDRELWREQSTVPGDPDNYYAPSIHVTASGGIGINVGGTVIVKPLREWHELALTRTPLPGQQGASPSPLLSERPHSAGADHAPSSGTRDGGGASAEDVERVGVALEREFPECVDEGRAGFIRRLARAAIDAFNGDAK